MNEREGSEEGGEGLESLVAVIDGATAYTQPGRGLVTLNTARAEAVLASDWLRDHAANRDAEVEHWAGMARRAEDRAESAESARDTALREKADLEARLAAVEALADEWETRRETGGDHAAHLNVARRIRAALANPSAAQREAEVGARALREYADLAESRKQHMDERRSNDRRKESQGDGRERNVWDLVAYELRARADALATDEAEVPR